MISRLQRSLVCKLPVLIWLLLFYGTGCIRGTMGVPDCSQEFRRLRTGIKIKTPDRILTTMATVTVCNHETIRLEANDMIGLTHAILMMDKDRVQFFNVSSRCKTTYSFWAVSLTQMFGVEIKMDRLIHWIFPEIWPVAPVVIKMNRKGYAKCEIHQYPGGNDGSGRVVVKIPDRKMEFTIQSTDQENVVFQQDHSDPVYLGWPDCDSSLKLHAGL